VEAGRYKVVHGISSGSADVYRLVFVDSAKALAMSVESLAEEVTALERVEDSLRESIEAVAAAREGIDKAVVILEEHL
jgi:hypothetical protein